MRTLALQSHIVRSTRYAQVWFADSQTYIWASGSNKACLMSAWCLHDERFNSARESARRAHLKSASSCKRGISENWRWTECGKKYSSELFAIFLATDRNFNAKFYTLITNSVICCLLFSACLSKQHVIGDQCALCCFFICWNDSTECNNSTEWSIIP